MEKGIESLEVATDYQPQGSNLSSRMTMASSVVVGSLEAGLRLVCTIAISLFACVKGRPKTFPKSPWDQGGELNIQPCHSTLVYTREHNAHDCCLQIPLYAFHCSTQQSSELVSEAPPHNSQTLPWQGGFVCLERPQWQTDTAGIFFFLWERAGFKGDICVKKLFSHQPLLRCPDRKGRVGEEWHIIKWTIKKFPNFWLQLTSELSPVPIFWLIIWWTQAAKLVWGVSQPGFSEGERTYWVYD